MQLEMLQSNDDKIVNIHFVYLTNRILKLDYHISLNSIRANQIFGWGNYWKSKISCTDFHHLLEKKGSLFKWYIIQESILIKEMRYSEFVMKMNPNCFAAISKRIDYCNIREVENTKFYCLKLVIQRRGQSAKICHRITLYQVLLVQVFFY